MIIVFKSKTVDYQAHTRSHNEDIENQYIANF